MSKSKSSYITLVLREVCLVMHKKLNTAKKIFLVHINLNTEQVLHKIGF